MKPNLAFLTSCSILSISSGQFLTPEWRNNSNDNISTEFSHWDIFLDPTPLVGGISQEPFPPDTATDSPTNDAFLLTSTVGAFITSSFNIYSFSEVVEIQLTDSTNFEVDQVLLQTGTLGNDLEETSFRFIYVNTDNQPVVVLPTTQVVLDEEVLGGQFGGIGTRRAIEWDLRDYEVTGTFFISYRGAGSSVSTDQVLLDTSSEFQSVLNDSTSNPEPIIAPELDIEIVGTEVSLTWTEEGSDGFILMETNDLSGDIVWIEVSEQLLSSQGIFSITLQTSQNPTFFRLENQTIREPNN